MFIAFDGLDGAGKTTICNKVFNYLKCKYHDVNLFDMGQLGFIDDELLSIKNGNIQCDSVIRELLYYFEGNLFSEKYVKKALNNNNYHAIIDRYLLSYFSYGPLNGISVDRIRKLTEFMEWPDVYFYIDIEPTVAIERITKYRKIDKPEIGFKNNLDDNEQININKFLTHQTRVKDNFFKAFI